MNNEHMKDACDIILSMHEEFIRVRSGIERLILPAAQEHGLTPTQVSVLNIIKKKGYSTVSELFKILDFNQGNMSSMCKKLEAEGFIYKYKSPEDERKSYLAMTDKGLSALEAIDRVFFFSEDTCWLSKEELDQAREAIATLRSTAHKVNDMLTAALEKRKAEENA